MSDAKRYRQNMAAPHTPIADLLQTRIECPDCGWRQLLDEDLHEGHTAALIAWHQAHPEQGIDHLAAAEGFQGGLGIAEYVRWTDDGLGRLALGDERTGQAVHFNHECLAVMESVHATSGLTHAVQRTRHRLDYSRSQATATVVDLALRLYRTGLLIPAPSPSNQPPT